MKFMVSIRLESGVEKFEMEVQATEMAKAEAELISRVREKHPEGRISYQKMD